MLRKQWQEYALKARQISKRIITGDEVNRAGTRLIKVVDNLDIYATAALNTKYAQEGSKANVHTYWGGKQEISTEHTDGSKGIFQTCGAISPTNNAMDIEIKDYMDSLSENKQYNTNTNMKQTIKLTESKLRGMIQEAVRRALTESIEGESNLDPEIVQAINNVAKGKVDKNHYDYYQDLRFLKTQGYRVAGDEVYRVSDKTVVAKFLAIYGRKNRNLECPVKDVVVKFLE